MERRWEFDALRGLMLVLMTLTHLPTRFSDPAGQPFGFVSAAEGFVMLSAFMAGMVYARRDDEEQMRAAFLMRALKIYLCQAALLLFVFSFIAVMGLLTQQDAVKNLLSFYLEQPVTAFVGSLLLLYNPPLLDILPLYILFMLLSPLLLVAARGGWAPIMGLSLALWIAAQFDAGRAFYQWAAAAMHLRIPVQQTGAFEILGWQFLWVLGLWMGSTQARGQSVQPTPFPPWAVAVAVAIGIGGMAWRHAVGQVPFPGNATLNLLFDKWHLGPLRLIDFLALVLIAMHFGPRLAARMPRPRALEMLGSASLPVFCAHLVLAMLCLALFGEARAERPASLDVAILAGSFAILFAVAWVSRQVDRYAASVKKRVAERRARRLRPERGPGEVVQCRPE